MSASRVPTWVLLVVGAVAVVAGVLGVVHAGPAVAKVVWAVVVVVGVTSLALAAGRLRRR